LLLPPAAFNRHRVVRAVDGITCDSPEDSYVAAPRCLTLQTSVWWCGIMRHVTNGKGNDPATRTGPADPAHAKPAPFDWQDYWAMVIAAFQVLWAPILIMLSGFVIVYVIAWIWMMVL